jgi:hypothetical protein
MQPCVSNRCVYVAGEVARVAMLGGGTLSIRVGVCHVPHVRAVCSGHKPQWSPEFGMFLYVDATK